MTSPAERVYKASAWKPWSGSEDDLRRLLDIVESRYEPLVEGYVERATNTERATLKWEQDLKASFDRDREHQGDGMDPGIWSQREAKHLEKIERAAQRLREAEAEAATVAQILTRVTSPDQEERRITAKADAVARYVAHRAIKSVTFESPNQYVTPRHQIVLRGDTSRGLRLEVDSDDAQWSIAAFNEIACELAKHVPWWRWIRSFGVLFGAVFICLMASATLLVGFATHGNQKDAAAILISIAFVGSGVSVWFAGLIQDRIPAFAVLPSGKTPPAVRVVTVLGGLLGTVAIGVLTNGISNLVLR